MSPQQRPGQGPPINLTAPSANGVVHIDMAAPAAAGPSGQNADLAGVLRRNQACLQCRKRKLKCDAARPHCATCVRSYRHSLRTAPKSNPVLCCDYDDGLGHEEADATHQSISPSPVGDEEDTGAGKKKRKASSGEGKRKKKDEVFEEERDRLTRQIEELQAQLSRRDQPEQRPQQQWVNNFSQPANKAWSSSAQPFSDPTIAPSPTAFFEMLSSAAHGKTAQQTDQTNPGPIFGTQYSTPFFPLDSHVHAASGNAIDADSNSPDQSSRRTSTQDKASSNETHESSSAPNILSPNGVFNFSPGDTTENNLWPPPFDPDAGLQPSTRLDGPWKAVETVDTVFATMAASASGPDASMDMGGDLNLDGLQAGLDAAVQEQLLMDLFWPGWPADLPEPNVVTDLIEAFFEYVPDLPRVLHRPRFLSRMSLPPTHSNFPHPALIHAVCAAAAAWCPPRIYEKSKKAQPPMEDVSYGIGLPIGEKSKQHQLSFGLRQASYAKEAVTDGLNTGNRLFDVVRAMIILCRVFIDDTRMLECWAYSGLVSRMILPLGLNVRSAELSLKSVMLPPPADALEREERRATVWMAFYHDSIASSASGWGTSMALDELTVPLPVSARDFELGMPHIEPNPQDLESPDLWIHHPVADSFVLLTKAALLINRVNRFARKWKNRHLKDDDDYEGMNRPEFRELSNAIACFQMSFPASLRNCSKLTAKGKFDIDLIAAHMLPYTAIICLYEPFADLSDPSDPSTRRILNASQSITSLVQQLAGTVARDGTNFTSHMHASISVSLVTAGRTLLVFTRNALNMGDEVSAQMYRMEVETIRIALSQFGQRFKLGHHHAQLLEYFTDRCVAPTYDKLCAHFPEHPRQGAMELRRDSNMGLCVMHALNVKRGFWRINKPAPGSGTASAGVSPLQSTPDSSTSSTGPPCAFSARSNSTSTNDTSHTGQSGSEKTSSIPSNMTLSQEDQARFAQAQFPGTDGYLRLVFGATEDDVNRSKSDSASGAAAAAVAVGEPAQSVGVSRPGYGVDAAGLPIAKGPTARLPQSAQPTQPTQSVKQAQSEQPQLVCSIWPEGGILPATAPPIGIVPLNMNENVSRQ